MTGVQTCALPIWDEYESEASEASVFCFDNASSEKSCFVDGLVCFISLCLRVFEFAGANQVVRHICIRCIKLSNSNQEPLDKETPTCSLKFYQTAVCIF